MGKNFEQNPKPLYVTRPVLPPLEDFNSYLEEIWENRRLTNNGAFHRELEQKLAEFLGVRYVSLFSNGTLALVTALQVLRIGGEVITTPYTFAATTHSINWNGIKPVFCDIEPKTMNMDPEKIEALITPKTTAILPVHVYGNPCEIEKIQTIADIHGLKVIYDAAHAFGVKKDKRSILSSGDLSVLSFHATKIFTTMEGGAIVCNDPKLKKRIDFLKNFGFADETTVIAPGINGKMNEMQAALGLLQLKEVDKSIASRQKISARYRMLLSDIPGLRFLNDLPGITHNYSYFPVFIHDKTFGRSRDQVYEFLKTKHIFTRRYFYPLTSSFPMYRGLSSAGPAKLPTAHEISEQVLCLPLYPALSVTDQDRVARGIVESRGNVE